MSTDGAAIDPATTGPRIVGIYLGISGLFTLSASVIWGVNTLFLLDAGLDIFQVFVANGAFTAGMVLFEIPTGVVADTYGRRLSFLLSAATLTLVTLAYVGIAATGGGLARFMAASLVLGLGFSFYSGAVEAWLVDALAATGHDEPLDRVFAHGEIVSGGAMLAGSVCGGLLGTIDLAWPFLVRACLLAAVFLVGLRAMHDVGFTPRALTASAVPGEMRRVLDASLTFGWRSPSVRLLTVVSLFQGGLIVWAFYAWQPYFLELLGHDAAWVAGGVSALIAMATIAGNGVVDHFADLCAKRTTMLLASSAVLAIAAAGVGVVDSFWPAVAFLVVAIGATGVSTPVHHAYLHELVPSSERATVTSFNSLVGSAGGIGGQVGLGYQSRAQSVATAYMTGGLAMLLALPPLVLLRRRREPADLIAGRKAGTTRTCAAQGLPPIATVDNAARQPTPAPEPAVTAKPSNASPSRR